MKLSWRALVVAAVGAGAGVVAACVGEEPQVVVAGDAGPVGTTDAGGDVEAPPPEDAGPSTFCSGKSHEGCFDFDRSDDVTSGWYPFAAENGCSYNPTTADYRSKPQAARFLCGESDAGMKANLVKRIDGAGKSGLHVELDYKLGVDKVGEGQMVNYLALYENTEDWVFTLSRTSNSSVLHNAADSTYPLSPALPTGKWAHLVIDATFHPMNGSVKLTVDGDTLVERSNVKTSNVSEHTTMSVQLGPFTLGHGPSVDMLVDNVVIDGT